MAKKKQTDDQSGLTRITEVTRGSDVRLRTRIRNYFLTGLVIAAPVSITIYLTWTFVKFVDDSIKPWLPALYNPDHYLPFSLPGVGLIFAFFAITMLGALTANLFGRTLVSYGEMMLNRMPVVRNLYNALKQIFETVVSQSQTSFKEVGVIEYPRRGLYAIVFVSTETGGEVKARFGGGDGMLSVFLPTTPNPTSGFLLFVPRKQVTILDMSVEDAAKLVISAGLVAPDYGKLASKARAKKDVDGKDKPDKTVSGKAGKPPKTPEKELT
ncbi:MAG: DUF502 domain-containing protein [Fimbriimonadaceae bacterium]|nr:DUF502 domain-containing protein [Alphaproteobacteria bacterium]